MTSPREDYIVRYSDKRSTMVEEFLSATHDTVQAWILAELNPGQLLEVRTTSLDELARNVTEAFHEGHDEDAPSYAHEQKVLGAEHAYRMGRG